MKLDLSRPLLAALLVAALAAPAAAQAPAGAAAPAGSGATTWRIDPTHSELTFQIRHLVSRVRGTFGRWEGTITADAQRLDGGQVEVAIETASIDTNNERRDNHLRTADFFEADVHPTITFRSTRVEVQGEQLRVHGDLTIRGVTRPVVLEGEFLGTTRDAQGRQRMGFEAETTINRHDYGVAWNRAVEGSNMLGDEVRIQVVVAAVEGA